MLSENIYVRGSRYVLDINCRKALITAGSGRPYRLSRLFSHRKIYSEKVYREVLAALLREIEK